MFYGGLFYTIGWIMREIATLHPGNLPIFIIQSIFIYLAPPIYSAAEYNTLGRLMHYLPMHSIVNPNRIVYIFVFLGSLVEVLTAIGSSWMAGAQGKDDQDLYVKGATCISIAVVLQALVELAFILMVGILHYRCVRAKMLSRNVRTVFIMLYGTSILILIRCVFRSVESFQLRSILDDGGDKNAALLKHEWPLYVFETIPVVLYTYWLNVIHPGRFLPNNQRQYLDFDGQTERMGPGWIHKRHWIMFIADPFDFIGMLTMKKRDEFYLEPEKWPVVEACFAQGTGDNTVPKEEVPIRKETSQEAERLYPSDHCTA
ncbi:Fc.00g103690.m01.CDS01 [Cosmosporella sp. VM-42]